MSGVLFNSFYDSELPNAKGCAQWKIELQLFGKGGSVIVVLSLTCMAFQTHFYYFRCAGNQVSMVSTIVGEFPAEPSEEFNHSLEPVWMRTIHGSDVIWLSVR